MYEKLKQNKRGRAIAIILGILVIFSILSFVIRIYFFTAIEDKAFYAVFLDNGQVYFGKVAKQTENEIVLDYVFYLKADTDLSSPDNELPNANLSLVKLGNEIYKPQDRMLINRSHVLFLEEMRPGSEIMQAINKYEQQDK